MTHKLFSLIVQIRKGVILDKDIANNDINSNIEILYRYGTQFVQKFKFSTQNMS